jgi:hypothetical protein
VPLEHNNYDSLATSRRASLTQIRHLWEDAAQCDTTLTIRPRLLARLAEKRVKPERFSRSLLFRHIFAGEPSLLSHFPIQLGHKPIKCEGASILEFIRSGFPRAKRARVRGARSVRYLPIPKVVDLWRSANSVFGVTDLHYIGTRFDARLNTSALNDFNLLPRGTDGYQSQDSLVVSSAKAFTDSHSDDHSGSNHCFEGAKLWLMWDTTEGFKHGLEDVERCKVKRQASFDIQAFLSMRSSSWLLIGPGQTIFVPGNLTHKVITLRQYLGLGSFYAALPSFIDSIARWTHLPPVWARQPRGNDNHCCVAFIMRRAIRRIHILNRATERERLRWGVPFLQARLQQLQSNRDSTIRDLMEEAPNLKAFIRAAQRL